MTDEEANAAVDSIEDAAANSVAALEAKRSLVPIEYFERLANKATRMVNAPDVPALKVQSREYRIHFDDPAIVSSLRIFVTDFPASFKLPVRYFDLVKNRPITERIALTTNDDGTAFFEVFPYTWMKEIWFEPRSKRRAEREITKIQIWGFTPEDFERALETSLEIDSQRTAATKQIEAAASNARNAISSAEENRSLRDALKAEVEALTAERTNAQGSIATLQESEAEYTASLEEKRNRRTKVEADIETLNQSLEKERGTLKSLSREIQDKRRDLKDLQKNIDLFPQEITGYVEQGGKNIRLYIALGVIPMLLLVLITIATFYGSVELSTIYERIEEPDLRTMFFTRLPFTIVVGVIVWACYNFSRVFVSEIIRVNQQRLNLTKLSIVAKDVSDASTVGLDFSESEEYELRTYLKMQMLRQYLKPYFGKDYSYDINPSLFNLFKERSIKLGLPFFRNKKKVELEVSTNAEGDVSVNIDVPDSPQGEG